MGVGMPRLFLGGQGRPLGGWRLRRPGLGPVAGSTLGSTPTPGPGLGRFRVQPRRGRAGAGGRFGSGSRGSPLDAGSGRTHNG